MRLTKTLRKAFIRAAMADVPLIKYREQIEKLVLEDFERQMPPEVAKAYKKHPEYINRSYFYVNECRFSVSVPRPSNDSQKLTPATSETVKKLYEQMENQRKERDRLEDQLTCAAYGCTTSKALATMLPEFSKYLPAEEAATKNLPALANLVADFTKAGWPKSK